MKAVVYDRYGPPEVLHLEEVERPVPADDEILVRIHATTVTRTDCHMRTARPFIWRFTLGLRRPRNRILGTEFAGEVTAVGAKVTEFDVGDRVFGARSGAHAQYVCVPENRLVAHVPEGMTFQEAAAVTDGFNQGFGPLERLNVDETTRLLVYGASGSCGTAAVQDVLLVKELIEAGKYRAVVDRTHPLEDVVEATHYVESWQKTGNVVLTVSHNGEETT